MIKVPIVLILVLLLGACAMNNLFLHPFELTPESRYAQYQEETGDTLRLDFDSSANPRFYYEDGKSHRPGYSVRSTFFESGNRKLNAWILTPDSTIGTSLFFLHGNAGNIVWQYQLVEPFLDRGYKVFLFDYSEFGFSGGKATRKNILEDSNAAFRFMQREPEFQNERTIVYGQSLGGHLAAVVGTTNQDEIEGVVIEGGFSSHKDIAADRVPVLGRIFVREMYSGKDSIANLKKPLLVIHSNEDAVVPFDSGKELYRNATEPKSFYEIDKRHIRGPLYYADSISNRMQKMLR